MLQIPFAGHLVVALLLTAAPAAAQPDPGSADPEAAVRAVVAGLFDGMRARDTSAVRAAFHPTARLHAVGREDEAHGLQSSTASEFVAALGASADVWDERVADLDVRIDDGLATVRAGYMFFLGDRFSHCGVDAFTLVQDAAGWRILDLAYTVRTGCD